MTAPSTRPVGRVWHGRTSLANAHAYQEHLRNETLPGLAAIEGFEQAIVLRRVADQAAEFLVFTLWASQDAVDAFAGEDSERAVIPAAAARVLARWDERASHYEVALMITGLPAAAPIIVPPSE